MTIRLSASYHARIPAVIWFSRAAAGETRQRRPDGERLVDNNKSVNDKLVVAAVPWSYKTLLRDFTKIRWHFRNRQRVVASFQVAAIRAGRDDSRQLRRWNVSRSLQQHASRLTWSCEKSVRISAGVSSARSGPLSKVPSRVRWSKRDRDFDYTIGGARCSLVSPSLLHSFSLSAFFTVESRAYATFLATEVTSKRPCTVNRAAFPDITDRRERASRSSKIVENFALSAISPKLQRAPSTCG